MKTEDILPQTDNVIEEVQKAYQDVCEGKLPEFPTIEWYIHSTGTCVFAVYKAVYLLLSS